MNHNKQSMCVHADTGGVCTFCGAKVSLSRSGASEVRTSAAERLRERHAGGSAASSSAPQPSSSAESESTAIAEAKAFKDRLVCCLMTCLTMPGSLQACFGDWQLIRRACLPAGRVWANKCPHSKHCTAYQHALCRDVHMLHASQVDYDRNAAKRTNVIDDQSDFFEIDSNAWLTDEVPFPSCGCKRAGAEAAQHQHQQIFHTHSMLALSEDCGSRLGW